MHDILLRKTHFASGVHYPGYDVRPLVAVDMSPAYAGFDLPGGRDLDVAETLDLPFSFFFCPLVWPFLHR